MLRRLKVCVGVIKSLAFRIVIVNAVTILSFLVVTKVGLNLFVLNFILFYLRI